jgi:hypothetical protein
MTEHQLKQHRLREAIELVLNTIDPTQENNNHSVSRLLTFGADNGIHGQVLGVYQRPDNPLHDVVRALAIKSEKLKGRGGPDV